MKTHTLIGKKIIDDAVGTFDDENYLKEARNMAAYHHERWDGKGYPEGLSGEEIPLSARIMAIADVFDALISPRVYKDPFPFEVAISIIRENSGSQFDPKLIEAFLDSLDEVKEVLKQYNHEI
jgi:HD-GYP domain-containing protein (c-di-GMP phosphodiesterase class II)